MSILLFRDAMLGGIVQRLRERGAPHAILDWDAFVMNGSIAVEVDGDGGRGELVYRRRRLRLEEVSAVLYTQPWMAAQAPRLEKGADTEGLLAMNRWSYVLDELHAATPEALWVPGPPLAVKRSAQRKLSELALAVRCGLRVPHTLCTTSAAQVERFMREHGGRIVFRDWATPQLSEPDGTPLYFPVVVLEGALEDKEGIAEAPAVFQEYVEKDYEIRAIVLGDDVYAVKIDSQASPAHKVDWRGYDLEHVAFTRYELPGRVAKSLARFAKRLGLAFGSADLIREKGGEYCFLELNRPGAWGFFSTIAGLDLADRIGDFLIAQAAARRGPARGGARATRQSKRKAAPLARR